MKLSASGGEEKPAVVVVSSPGSPSPAVTEQAAPSAAARVKKYRVPLAVVGCVMVLGVVAAFVGVFAINSRSITHIIKHRHFEDKDPDGKKLKEDVEIDETENIAKFTVSQEDGDVFRVISDYDRKLVVMEAPPAVEGGVGRCLVSVLNTSTSAADLENIIDAVSPKDSETTSFTSFVQLSSPIPNPEFLPKAAMTMCKDRDVFWAVQQCGPMEEKEEEEIEQNGG